MKNKRNTMRDLMISVLALLMSCSMLVGTTMAWFTDEVTVGGNIIQSGNLDIVLEKWDNETSTWVDLETLEDKSIFNYDKWEPGYTQVVALRIRNNGNLALKWQGAFTSAVALGPLAEVINVYTLAGHGTTDEVPALIDNLLGVSDRTVVNMGLSMMEKQSLKELSDAAGSTAIAPKGELLEKDDASYMFVVLQMDPEAGNEYQGENLAGEFGLTILATQYTYENDSFGNDYDKDAQGKEELEGNNATFDGTYNLSEDHNDNLTVNAGVEADINLNDNAINGTVTNKGDATISGGEINGNVNNNGDLDISASDVNGTVNNNGDLAISDSKIDVDFAGFQNNGNATLTNVEMEAGTATDYSNILNAGSSTTYNDVNITSNGGGIGAVNGATGVFNSGSLNIEATTTSPRYNFYIVGEGTTFTINGGKFDFTVKTLKRAYIYAGPGTTVYVNGGTFGTASTRSGYTAGILGDGTVIITGGTFGFNPSNWVAEGYETVKDGSTWTVQAKTTTTP